MVEYFEVHMSRRNFERLIFISLIILLLLITIIAWNRDLECPEVICEEPEVVEKVVVKKVVKEVVEEESITYYADIANFNFAPKELIIREGATVTFRNQEKALVHKLYEVKNLFVGPRMEPNDEFSYTFTDSGNYTIWSIMGKDKGTKMLIEVIE